MSGILQCEAVEAAVSRGTDKHYHSWLEIYYLLSGECSCLIDDTIYKLTVGDLMLIPPGSIHQSAYCVPRYSRLLINCSEEFYSKEVLDYIKENGFIFRNAQAASNALEILKKIEEELKRADAYSQEMAASYLKMLFVTLFRNPNHYVNDSGGNVYVKKVLGYVKKNYASEVTLCAAAQMCAITPEHLSRIFKQETGMTFREYLTEIRFQSAEKLLCSKNKMSVSQIADACGFNDSNYFSSRFKAIYGMSPLQYRKKKNAR